MSRIHQVVAITNINKVTRIPSRACSRCNIDLCCGNKRFDGYSTQNPFCAILGPSLCKNCSLIVNRQQKANDTKRILEKFSEPVNKRDIKEQALLYRMDEILKEDENGYRDCARENEDFFPPGYVARNNTPDILYLNSRRRKRERKKSFCQKPIRNTLQTLSLKMTDEAKLKKLCHSASVNRSANSRKKAALPNVDEEISLPQLNSKVFPPTVSDELNNSNWSELDSMNSLNTNELQEKLSSVFEQRYLPPIKRTQSTASSVDGDVDINLPSATSPELEKVIESKERDISSQVSSDEKIINDDVSNSFNVVPLIMKLDLQLSRQNMFSNKEDVIPKDGKNIIVSQRNVPLLRIKKNSRHKAEEGFG